MVGTLPDGQQRSLFNYYFDLEKRIPAEDPIRRLRAILDLEFVLVEVARFYGRCGNKSVDPRVIVKLMLLLFYYQIPSERTLMTLLVVRLDFLWFLGFDLETPIPDHSVLSKARARWGKEVFEKVFQKVVEQCVEAGLVDGRLLHVDSTMVKAQASKNSVVKTSPELVEALRKAYQDLESKLEVIPGEQAQASEFSQNAPTGSESSEASAKPAYPPLTVMPEPAPVTAEENVAAEEPEAASCPVKVFEPPIAELSSPVKPQSDKEKAAGPKLPVNSTHISRTDPIAQLSRSKNGLTELNNKEHRLVDDAHGVITAVITTLATVPDGSQLPPLVEQHFDRTRLRVGQVSIAGDGHYGTADNYLYCQEMGIRGHLAEVSAHLEDQGLIPVDQFKYEPESDHLRCPQGHVLERHQHRPEENLTVYLISDPVHCAQCPLRKGCTKSKRGRSVKRHVHAERLAAARAEANSAAGRYSRKRRQHVIEGRFADAANNHRSKRARWRGLEGCQIQSYLIAAAQNLRVLIKKTQFRPTGPALEAEAGRLVVVGEVLGALGECLSPFRAFWSFPNSRQTHLQLSL